MKHPTHTHRTLSLFDTGTPHEKGSREWGAFAAVQEDFTGAYRVAQPKMPMVVRSPRNVLWIIPPRPLHLHSAH